MPDITCFLEKLMLALAFMEQNFIIQDSSFIAIYGLLIVISLLLLLKYHMLENLSSVCEFEGSFQIYFQRCINCLHLLCTISILQQVHFLTSLLHLESIIAAAGMLMRLTPFSQGVINVLPAETSHIPLHLFVGALKPHMLRVRRLKVETLSLQLEMETRVYAVFLKQEADDWL